MRLGTVAGMRLTVPPRLRTDLPMLVGGCVAILLVGVVIGHLLPAVGTPVPADTDPLPVFADGHVHGATTDDTEPDEDMGGLSLSGGGYTLIAERTRYPIDDAAQTFDFTIRATDSAPVTDFVTIHDRPLHLFVVRRDLTGYQHLHPTLDTDTGRWHTAIRLDEPGDWRAIADFTVAAPTPVALTLGVDLTVPGEPRRHEPPQPAEMITVDGFTVSLETSPVVGVAEPLLVTITRDGAVVDPEPYLGAHGHLILLRHGDVGFGHAHPDPEPVGDARRYWLTVPSAGHYVGHLDVRIDGRVHTVRFGLVV